MAARLTTYVVVAIVSATLIAGLIVGAQRDDSDGPVDLIVHNARIYTADEDQSLAEAVAVRGNQILRVGSNREITRLRRPQTTVIDARGASVLPGFNDAHVHLIAGGLTLKAVDLHDALTVEAVQQRLKLTAEADPLATWIRARRWPVGRFTGVPTRDVLDAAVADRPVLILADDKRTAWVNTAALDAASITRRTENPENGTIVRDARGEATGVLKGTAVSLVERLAPAPTKDERAAALRDAVKLANRYGITSVQSAGDSVEDFDLYQAARKAGDLTVRVYGALAIDSTRLTDAQIDALGEVSRRYPDDPGFKTGAAKLRVDGEIETRTAALLQPYSDKPVNAEPVVGADDLNRTARILDSYGWQIMAHASGDRAVNMALNAYAHAARSNAPPQRGRRHRIEHADLVSAADAPRFRSLGVIASLQPEPEESAELWPRLLGPERFARASAFGSLAGTGTHLAIGSGWPDAALDPLAVLQAAVEAADDAKDAGTAGSRLPLKTAIDAYTVGAAYASFDEGRKGSISSGMLADLVVLSDDIFAEPARPLTAANVAVTIFDGKIVYRRGATD